ncbi:hypothetical protein [Terrabacter terrigena]|uniref:Uncharacterized protein n=1 Tax=Terrabacter terrigena TaxID=574718 RepID=A0ABW3MVQ4_9MICO
MRNNRVVTGIAAIVAAAGLIGTGAVLSNAASTTPTATATSQNGSANPNNDTPVTGDELSKVTSAVKGNDSTVTVTSARRDPDGSYDVFGTKAGADVMLEVSKDLKTITAGGHDGGHHGGGGSNDTPVTGAELSKVTTAVTANDSAVTVASVRMDPDGSYDVFGTKAGTSVRLEVSKDLKTITADAGGHRG